MQDNLRPILRHSGRFSEQLVLKLWTIKLKPTQMVRFSKCQSIGQSKKTSSPMPSTMCGPMSNVITRIVGAGLCGLGPG